MANNFNTNLTTTDGPDFASNEITGVHWPYAKIVFGADGIATLVTATVGLPISDAGGSITIDAASLPLPTGAATAALQLPNSHDVTIDNAAGAAAVNIQDGGNTITVDGTVGISGTVTTTVSGAVDTELPAAVALADNTANPTVPGVGAFLMAWDGANWDRVATPGVGAIAVSIIDTILNTELPTANSLADNMANPTAPAVAAHGMLFDGTNWDRWPGDSTNGAEVQSSQLPAALVGGRLDSNNGAWLGSTAPTVGQKAMASSVPVVIASDQSTVAIDIAGQSAGNVAIGGSVAHDAAAAGNPVPMGLRANTSEPATAVADGDSTYAWGDRHGRQVVVQNNPPKPAAAGTHGPYSENSVASGDVELIAAPGASTSIVVTGFWISNQGTAKNRVALREGAAGTIRYRGTVAADGGGIEKANLNWMLPANTALTINIGTAGDIDANVDFYTQITT